MLHRVLTSTLLLFALPAALLASDIPIAGRVLTAGGEPAAKAEVWLEPIPPTYERAVLRLAGRAGPDAVATTRADADGNFELAAPAAGMWKVVVSAPGMLTVERRLVPVVEATALTPVRLTPAADLEVRLVDAQGKPRPGRVGAFAVEVRDAWRPRLRLADAGEDGVARLPLGANEKIQLEVLAGGGPLAVFKVYDETSVTLDVPDGVAGTVRVTDRRREPLAGAVAFQGSALLPLGSSDAEGRIALVLQAQEAPPVKVVTADRSHGSFELDFAETAGGEVRDLRLEAPATIRGEVLDLSSRDPVAGALVWAVRGELAFTDPRGRYALDAGAYRSRSVRAIAAGYLEGESRLDEGGAGDAVAIGLPPAASLAGRVIDAGGVPVAGVEVALALAPQSGNMPMAAHRVMHRGPRGRTSERGAFRLAGLPAGVGFRLTFTAEGFAPRWLEVDPLEPFESRADLEVVLESGRLAFGRVVDEDAVPVAGAEIVLRAPRIDETPGGVPGRFSTPPDQPRRLTGAEGRFEIADLAPGSYDLEVRAAGFAPARVPGVRVEGDAETDFGTVVLIPGARVEGRVRALDGAAVAGAEIAVHRELPGLATRHDPAPAGKAITGAQGGFVVADLPPGQPVSVSVHKQGFGSELVVGVRPPTDEPLAIVLLPTGRLKGRVLDVSGSPIEKAQVIARPEHREARASRTPGRWQRPSWDATDVEGRFEIEEVKPGTLRVNVRVEGYRWQERTGVELPAGAELELEFVLEEGAVVEGTVTTTDGEPVVEASISVSERYEELFGGAGTAAGGRTGADGRYRVTGAPAGPATIAVFQQNGRQVKQNVELRPGTNLVDLVLERGFEVSGQVVGPGGEPVAGAELSMRQVVEVGSTTFTTSGTPKALTGAGGAFTLDTVAAGDYQVIASRAGYVQATTETFEVSGDVTGLVLALRRGATLKGRVLGLDFDELGSLTLFAHGEGMRQGRVDFAGEYVFDGLAAGRWNVEAHTASGRSAKLGVEVPEGVSEVVKDLEFGSGFTVSGLVLDGGRPLAGARVSAGGPAGFGSATTGSDGRFRIEDLPAGPCEVTVRAGMALEHTELFELAGDRDLRVELASGSLSGQVLADSGEPLAGVAVDLGLLDTEDARSSGVFVGQLHTDSQGLFRASRLRQGAWRLVATKSGYAPAEATATVARVDAPRIEIRMTPTEGVTFEPVHASGLPLAAVRVAILDASGRSITDGLYPVTDGKVRVSTVPPGRRELIVQATDSAATRFTVDSPGDQGRLWLPIGGSLLIHVPALEEVPRANVRLTGPDGKPFASIDSTGLGPGEWPMHLGRTQTPVLVPGVWSVTVTHDGRTWSGSATVTPGATNEVTVP